MGQNEQIGLDSVWNNAQFNKGQAEYLSKIAQAQTATQAVGGNVKVASDSFGLLGNGLLNLAANAGVGSAGMLALGVVMGGTMAIGKALVDMIAQAGQAVVNFGGESIMTASRVQQLSYIAQTLGQMSGYTSEEVLGFVKSVQSAGISVGVSNQLIAQFARYNLDMTKAVELAKVAQDAATLSNKGSSEALEGIIHGMTVLSPIVLRHNNVMVDFEDAYKKYGESIGVAADALSAEQKVTAGLNAILENGKSIAGAYAASMMTAGKQMGSLTSRLLPDLQNALGAPFQAAFYNVVKGINNMVTGITKLISEGGALYPVLINIGAAFSLITEPFETVTALFAETGGDIFQSLADTLGGAVDAAFGWGYNIASQLAQGLIDGAQAVIQGAIDWIGQLLTNWFAPGSPPKVAPEIDTWGGAAMTEYLKGFTEADYSVLKGLQAPLKDAFSTLVDLGALGKGDAGKAFQELSKEMMAGLTEGGSISEDFYKRLADATGPFGEQLVDLTKKQLALVDAEEQVKKAEEDLAAAKKKGSDAGAKVNKATMEYNQLLRSGASKGALAAKLKEINAAKDSQSVAKKEEIAAQGKLETAKDASDEMKKQVALQKELLDQLLQMAKTEKAIKDEEKDPGGGGGAPKPPTPGGGGGGAFDPDSILDPIRDAVEKAKQIMLDNFGKIWADIQALWTSGVNQLTTWLLTQWQKVADYFGLPSIEEIQAAWNSLIAWVTAQVEWFLGTLQIFWDNHGASILSIVNSLWNGIMWIITGVGQAIAGIVKFGLDVLRGYWDAHGAEITAIVTSAWNTIKLIWETLLEALGNVFDLFAALLKGDWGTVWNEILAIGSNIWTLIQLGWKLVIDWITNGWAVFSAWFGENWPAFWAGVVAKAQEIWNAIVTWFNETLWPAIQTAWTNFSTWFGENWPIFWNTVVTTATDIWNTFTTWITTVLWPGIQTKASEIFTAIQIKLAEIWAAIQTKASEVWTAISTWISTKFTEIQTFINTTITAIQTKWGEIWDAVSLKATEIWTAIDTVIRTIVSNLFAKMGLDEDEMFARWSKIWNDVNLLATLVWGLIYTAVTSKFTEVQSNIDTTSGTIKTNWETFWSGISTYLSTTWGTIVTNVTAALTGAAGLLTVIQNAVNEFLEPWKTKWGEIVDSLIGSGGLWEQLVTGVSDWLFAEGGLIDEIEKGIDGALTAIGEYLTDFYDVGTGIIQSITDGVLAAVGGLVETVTSSVEETIRKAIAAAWAAAGGTSDGGGGNDSGGGNKGGSGGGGGGVEPEPDPDWVSNILFPPEVAKAVDDSLKNIIDTVGKTNQGMSEDEYRKRFDPNYKKSSEPEKKPLDWYYDLDGSKVYNDPSKAPKEPTLDELRRGFLSGGTDKSVPPSASPSPLAQSRSTEARVPISSGRTTQYNTITINIPTTITSTMDQATWERNVIATVKKAIRS